MKKLLLLGLIGWAMFMSSTFAETFSVTMNDSAGYYNAGNSYFFTTTGILNSFTKPNNATCNFFMISTGNLPVANAFLTGQFSGNTANVGITVYPGIYYNIASGPGFSGSAWTGSAGSCDGYRLNAGSELYSPYPRNSEHIVQIRSFVQSNITISAYTTRFYSINSVTFTPNNTINYPDIYKNGSLIISDLQNDFNVIYTGDGTSDYNGTSLTITGLWASDYTNTIFQGLIPLSYTGHSFNIGVNLIPTIISGNILSINSLQSTGVFTIETPMEYSGSYQISTGNIFNGFINNISKFLFSSFNIWIFIFGGVLIFWFLGSLIRKRR